MFDVTLFDRFANIFDSDFYRSVGTVKSSNPYKVINDDDGKTTIIHQAIGLAKDDISISVNPTHGMDVLEIKGETVDKFECKYFIHSRFFIGRDTIERIEYTTENGILIIDIFKKIPETKQILIESK